MRFFDLAWSLSDGDDDASARYQARLDLVRGAVDPATAAFLTARTLHDAVVGRVVVSRDAVALDLVGGDLKVGYFAARIALGDAFDTRECAAVFGRLRGEVVEILHEEFDVATPGLVLRLRFADGGCLDIVAATLAIDVRDLPARPAPAPLALEAPALPR